MKRKSRNEGAQVRRPAFVSGTVTLDFWGNDDESYRNRTLKELAKTIRQELNVSVTIDPDPQDFERGGLVFAAAAVGITDARKLATTIMDAVEKHSPARLIDDNWIAEELP